MVVPSQESVEHKRKEAQVHWVRRQVGHDLDGATNIIGLDFDGGGFECYNSLLFCVEIDGCGQWQSHDVTGQNENQTETQTDQGIAHQHDLDKNISLKKSNLTVINVEELQHHSVRSDGFD